MHRRQILLKKYYDLHIKNSKLDPIQEKQDTKVSCFSLSNTPPVFASQNRGVILWQTIPQRRKKHRRFPACALE